MSKLIVFYKDQIILTNNQQFIELESIADFSQDLADHFLYLKRENKLVNFCQDHYTTIISEDIMANLVKLVDVFSVLSIRSFLLHADLILDNPKIKLITTARQLAQWNFDHQYCGRCGLPTSNLINNHHLEYAKECKSCGLVSYPRVTPCILAAVMRQSGDNQQLLLGRSPHFPSGVYSLLAGFVDVAESAEETVAREVYEETRISIANIRYFGSQPWPFPHSLMLAYTADYAGGEIVVDPHELEDAGWYDFHDIRAAKGLVPPAKGSLSRMLIDHLTL